MESSKAEMVCGEGPGLWRLNVTNLRPKRTTLCSAAYGAYRVRE